VAPIALGVSSMPGNDYFKFEFATPQAQPPFALGSPVKISGNSDGATYDGTYTPVGVVECTTDYVILYAAGYSVQPDGSGGTAELSFATVINPDVPATGSFTSTDCNGKVVINGATDRVFLSAQLNNIIKYEVFSGPADLVYYVSLNRYKGFVTTDPTNPEYRFNFDAVINQQIYTYTGLTGTGTLDNIETLFSTVIDNPEPAYYWYILDVMFYVPTGDMQVTQSIVGERSLSAQVVKQ